MVEQIIVLQNNEPSREKESVRERARERAKAKIAVLSSDSGPLNHE